MPAIPPTSDMSSSTPAALPMPFVGPEYLPARSNTQTKQIVHQHNFLASRKRRAGVHVDVAYRTVQIRSYALFSQNVACGTATSTLRYRTVKIRSCAPSLVVDSQSL
ncbi:hypothetical protein FQR65_LT02380 [Abscondita terminalis]|nr:hypothetical protein FQR65_LT02380 [Abscondita terminalis]